MSINRDKCLGMNIVDPQVGAKSEAHSYINTLHEQRTRKAIAMKECLSVSIAT